MIFNVNPVKPGFTCALAGQCIDVYDFCDDSFLLFNHNRTKLISLMGPSVKLVLPIIDSISKKMGLIFLSRKVRHKGVGGRGPREFCPKDTKFA